MQDFPLTITAVLRHGAAVYGGTECVTWTDDGPRRTTYGVIAQNAARLAHGLAGLGIGNGDRVGTFMWNSQEHMEAYLAVPSMGAVLNTVNIRLFPEQICYIVNHAKDRILFVDDSLVEALEPHAGELKGVEHFILV